MESDLPPDQSPPAAPPFQILRSRHDRKLGGVAGGLAAATQLDPTLVRLAIVLGCLTGWGILAYLIAWAVIPEEDPARGRYLVPAPEPTGKHLRIGLAVVAALGILRVVGGILGIVSSALVGLGFFPFRVFGLHHRGFAPGEAFVGLLLLIGGLLLLFRRHLPWAPAADGAGGPGAWGGQWFSGPSGTVGAGASVGPDAAPPPPSAAPSSPPAPASPGFGARASAAARAAVTNGPLLLVRAIGWLVGLWFLAAGVVGGLLWATGALHVHLPVLPIAAGLAALGALGYALLRTRRPAVVIGAMALLLVPAALAAALTRVDGQVGRRSVTPIVMADLEPTYRHAAGLLEIDLSRLQLPTGRTPLHLSMGAGKIDVTVPWDADVEASASVGVGSFELFGNRQSGVNLKGRTHSAGQPDAPVLVISGRAGAGDVVVERGSEPFTHEALRRGEPVPLHCVPGLNGSLRCSAADGVTPTPALGCVVADSGAALCRPVGEPEPAVAFANDPGTRHCQVPAGGGEATCTPPVPRDTATTTEPPPAPAPPGAPPGQYLCTIPDGGGPATCHPA
jgi:phage shock protein PspC (stress-responsive transcriptional regulator)